MKNAKKQLRAIRRQQLKAFWRQWWRDYFAIHEKLIKDIKAAFKMRKGAKNGVNKEATPKANNQELRDK